MNISKDQASTLSSEFVETNPISPAQSQGTGEGLDVSTIRLMEVPSVPPAGSGEGLDNVGGDQEAGGPGGRFYR